MFEHHRARVATDFPGIYILRRYFFTAMKLAVSVTLLVFLVQKISFAELAATLGSRLDYILAIAVLITLAGLACGGYRWWILIGQFGGRLSLPQTLRLTLVGHFFNQVLPTSIGGDAMRIWGATRQGVPTATAINSSLLDRIAGMLSLILLVLCGQPAVLARIDVPGTSLVSGIIMMGGIAIILLTFLFDRLVPAGIRQWRAAAWLSQFSRHLRSLIRQPGRFSGILLASLASHCAALLLGYFFAREIGISLSPMDALLIFPSALLISSLPFSIAGWGLREAGMAAGFALLGLSAQSGITVSILIGLANIITGMLGGVAWLLSQSELRPAPAEISLGSGHKKPEPPDPPISG